MTHKQHALTDFKLWPQSGSFRSHVHDIIAHLKESFEIPTGYEDETGFHFGREPVMQEIQWPKS